MPSQVHTRAVCFIKIQLEGGNSLKGATLSTYKKDEVKDGDAGKYTCTTTFAALPAKTSDEFEVSIIPPGPICSDDGQCDGNKKSLTGKCDKEKKRCVCAGGFAPKGNECDGVGQMVASLLLVLVAAIFARLM
ncbi:hypothetical protein RRG08_031486 [Elysia crispata]|uniref:Uncharacterized protein n=1 Tax=Elysia crispata TaxID=231223 RepID=A0AAE1DIZ1_9GAST|nr:hypothetical protein RRG08_031486 [Elysia crispata]